jgi:hypothetical protein
MSQLDAVIAAIEALDDLEAKSVPGDRGSYGSSFVVDDALTGDGSGTLARYLVINA